MKKLNDFSGLVYSTNKELELNKEEKEEEATLENSKQLLRIFLDRKNRSGKTVTCITGFVGREEDLEKLAKLLKTKCGVGGTIKDFEILIQGDFKKKIAELLENQKYKVKLIGG